MITLAPAASARPDIISLDILLSDVDEGRVRIPRFQRPYVWTPQMMRDLFESVLNGYPIGSLLFWTPRDLDVQTMDYVGPIQVSKKVPASPISYVLDGHQRLATLYGVLRLPESHPRDQDASAEELAWWLGYDLDLKQVKQLRRPDDFSNPAILPLRAVLRTADFVRFARTIDASTSLSAEQKTAYLDQADEVQRSIRDYRIALTSMRDGGVDDAVAIFSRVNRSGRRISNDQMAVALTFRQGFNLEDTLDEMLDALGEFGFGDVSRNIVLQSLLRGADRNFTKPNFDDLRKADTQSALAAASTPVKVALCDAAVFLNGVIGFRTGRLLPYAFQLLLLSVYFLVRPSLKHPLDNAAIYQLSRWFWATSFEGWFASANTSEVERAANAMEAFAANPTGVDEINKFDTFFVDRSLRPFPKTFDRRSARIRALLLMQIAGRQLIDPISGENIDGSELIADPGTRDLPYVFQPDGTKAARSPANRILLPRTHGSNVRAALEQAISHIEALESQGIDANAREAILARDLSAFVLAREASLQAQERAFLAHFALSVDAEADRSDVEIDVDE
jgi:hypothetical protein